MRLPSYTTIFVLAAIALLGGPAGSADPDDMFPVCRDGARDIPLPTSADDVTITVVAHDDVSLEAVELLVDLGVGYGAQPMFDDGLHGDGAAGDSVFGATIPAQPEGMLVRYYALARDGLGQMEYWPNDAPEEYRAYTVGYRPPSLQITEILARNDTGIVDEFNEYEDWIEICNTGDALADLTDMFLTDDFDQTHRWIMPEHVLLPGEYLLVWADSDPEQGAWHTNFKLSAAGEEVGLYDCENHGNVLLSGFTFGRMGADISVGYQYGNEDFPEYLATPTPAADNSSSELFSPVCINEFLTTGAFGGIDDWVELYNRGSGPVDIGGWFLSDECAENCKWAFPEQTLLAAGEYLVVYEDVLGFGWSSVGDEVVMLTAPDSLTGMDYYDFGPQSPDVTEGRCQDGVGLWCFFAIPTPGSMNYDPIHGVDDRWRPGAGRRILGGQPNPFRDSAWIQMDPGGTARDVALTIFAANGRRVRSLFAGRLAQPATLLWDGRDAAGRRLPSGAYFARLTTPGGFSADLRLIRVR